LEEESFEVSRSQIQGYIKDGYVVGPREKLKASGTVEPGQTYVLRVPALVPLEIEGRDVGFTVVYEDEDLIVVDKPRGVVVHPAYGHEQDTVVNGLVYRNITLSQLGGELRPGVVHRIDKDTSGLVMFAKTDAAYHGLSEQLRNHTVTREYVAIVHGVLSHDEGTIDAPVGRDPKNRQRMGIVDNGKDAITHFAVTHRYTEYTSVTCRLETGRTHQIRVHFAYIGHPLAGDPLYGRRHTLPIHGQALHAQILGFVHPTTGATLMFESPIPEDMQTLFNGLEADVIS
jgi:23S rRNA pseudouridine1911/1915/1917 synthase